MIYFDNAATTLPKPEPVLKAVLMAMQEAGNPGRGAYEASLRASRLLFEARQTSARLLGVKDPARIAFTKNVTEALNLAIGWIPEGAHVISTVTEHNSVLRPLYRSGNEVSFLEADEDGKLCYGDLDGLLKKNTKAIVITHASNVTGRITEIRRIADFAKVHGLLLIVDGAQAAGAVPIRAEEDGIDIYCFTGHKGLMGPQGTGGIYVRTGLEENWKLTPLNVGGSGIRSFDPTQPEEMPVALEAGTLNTPGIAGLNAGMQYVLQHKPERILQHEQTLARHFIAETRDLPGIHYYGWSQEEIDQIHKETLDRMAPEFWHTGMVSLNIGEEDAAWIADALWERAGVCVRAGAHCAPKMHEHFGTVAQGIVRFSFSWFNTLEEVKTAAEALRDIVLEE